VQAVADSAEFAYIAHYHQCRKNDNPDGEVIDVYHS
jgi:hypothetical protein